MNPTLSLTEGLKSAITRNVLFVSGKGGVGKTAVSQAIALSLSKAANRVLWVAFQDPTRPSGSIEKVSSHLFHLNCDAGIAFQEYATLKIGVGKLAKIFTGNRVVQYLARVAPGIHELVLLGKVWHERLNFDHVVVDMPSTGYGLALFQSTKNFVGLFKGGPIHRDAEDILATFKDRNHAAHLIVALPEEMPLQEALELSEHLREIFPENHAEFLVNRRFPSLPPGSAKGALSLSQPSEWRNPIPSSAGDYAKKRAILEEHNLRIWANRDISFSSLPYVPPEGGNSGWVAEALSELMQDAELVGRTERLR